MQPLGDGSPMGLLWNFMGFSDAYCIFTGAAEMVGGLLLVARRTTTLGALVSIGVMSNVVMLNFRFDTPVKLFSLNLLGMAGFLVLPDARRLADFLLFHRPLQHVPLPRLFARRWLHFMAIVVRSLFFAWTTWFVLKQGFDMRRQYGDLARKPPLYGSWDVEVFEVDGELVPEESVARTDRWKRLRIGRYRLSIERGDGSTRILFAQPSPKGDRLTLQLESDPGHPIPFKCELAGSDALTLDGTLDGRPLHVELARSATSGYLLLDRGFHWINETPFNRRGAFQAFLS